MMTGLLERCFFNRDALAKFEQNFAICGYALLGKDGLLDYPIDIQEDKIAMLEGRYNCLPEKLKNELTQYNIGEVPKRIWSRFFFQWQFLADMHCFTDNGSFYELCTRLLENNEVINEMRRRTLSIIEPQT